MKVVSLVGLLLALATPQPELEAEPAEVTESPRPFFYALSVADVEASTSWYERVLGFGVIRRIGGAGDAVRIHLLGRPGALLELAQSAAARSLASVDPEISKRYLLHGVFKIGFHVEDLDRETARLAKLQVPLRSEIVTELDGSLRSLQIADPDGNVIQIFETLTPASR